MTGSIFAWIDQTLQASYNQIFTVSNTVFDFSNTELKWKFIGGGLLGGSDVYLYIGKGFGFFTNGSFGLLVGRMRSLEHYKQIEEENGIFINRDEKYTRSFMQFKPTYTFSSGVDFKYWFAKCLMLHVLIGYEFNMLINMNQIGKLNQRTDSNDAILEVAPKGAVFNADPSNLYFHGLNVRAGIDF